MKLLKFVSVLTAAVAVLGMGERKKGTINSQWKEDEGDLQENRLPF